MPAWRLWVCIILPRRLLVIPTETELSITIVAPAGRTCSEIVSRAFWIIDVSICAVFAMSGVGTATTSRYSTSVLNPLVMYIYISMKTRSNLLTKVGGSNELGRVRSQRNVRVE